MGLCRVLLREDIYDRIQDVYQSNGVYCYRMPALKFETESEYEDRVMMCLTHSGSYRGPPWAAMVLHEGLLDQYSQLTRHSDESEWKLACAIIFVDGTRFVYDASEDIDTVVNAATDTLLLHIKDHPLPSKCSKCNRFLTMGHYKCKTIDCSGKICMPCLSTGMREEASGKDILKVSNTTMNVGAHPSSCAHLNT